MFTSPIWQALRLLWDVSILYAIILWGPTIYRVHLKGSYTLTENPELDQNE
jgi:hypothetical protein